MAAQTLGPQRAPPGLVTPRPRGACAPATLSPTASAPAARPLPTLLTELTSPGLLEGSGQHAPRQGAPDSQETPHARPRQERANSLFPEGGTERK